MKYDFTTLIDRTGTGSGKWDGMRRRNPDVPAGIVPFSVADMELKNPPEIKGETDMLVQVHGSFDNPQGTASLEIANGSVAGVSVDELTAMLSLADDNIKLQQLSLHQAVDIVIQTRHTQQTADITPNIFHLALNIMLYKVEIEVCTV